MRDTNVESSAFGKLRSRAARPLAPGQQLSPLALASAMLRSLWRWLAPSTAGVIAFERSRRPRSRPGASGGMRAALRSWQRSAALWRFLAVVRRWAIVAVSAAVVLVVIHHQLPAFPLWLAIVLPVLIFAIGSVVGGRASPNVDTVARLLDHDLGLREQVSSALEVGEGGRPLAVRLEDRATKLVERARGEWKISPRFRAPEWALLALLAAVLVLVWTAPAPARPSPPASGRPVALGPPPGHAPHIYVTVASPPAANPPPPTVGVPLNGQRPAPMRTNGQKTGSGKKGGSSKTRRQKSNPIPPGPPGPPATSIYSRGGQAPRTRHGQKTQGRAPLQHGHLSSPGQQTRRGGTPLGSTRSPAGGQGSGGSQLRGTSSGKSGSGKNGKPSGRQSVKGKTQSNPYGGNPGIIHSVSKPGLVTGPALNSSTHVPGNAAGHGRGANGGKPAPQGKRSGKGRQLTLKSPYGGASSGKQRSAPGKTGQQSSKTAQVNGGAGGNGSSDYIPPDPNSPPPGESALIARYFGSAGS